jgi:hypothetical protein
MSPLSSEILARTDLFDVGCGNDTRHIFTRHFDDPRDR